MSKKKFPKKEKSKSSAKHSPDEATGQAPSPYLPVAHPPAKNVVLLAVSAILFLGWFVFLVVTAIYSSFFNPVK